MTDKKLKVVKLPVEKLSNSVSEALIGAAHRDLKDCLIIGRNETNHLVMLSSGMCNMEAVFLMESAKLQIFGK